MKKSFTIFALGFILGLACATAVILIQHPQVDPFAFLRRSSENEGSRPGPVVTAEAPVPEPPEVYPYSISGRVIDEQGQGIASAVVIAATSDGEVVRQATSDLVGRFEIGNTPLGLYNVEASAEGYGPASATQITPDGPSLEMTLEAAADVIGRVVLDDEGVAGLTVFIAGPGIYPPVVVTSGEDGRFLIDGVSRSTYFEIVALGEEHGSRLGSVHHVEEGGQLQLFIEAACPLEIEVVESTSGTPIEADGVVTISSGPIQLLSLSQSIQAGEAVICGLPSQRLYLRVLVPGFVPWRGAVEHDCARQSIPLERGATLSGVIQDTNGAPVANAHVTAAVITEDGTRIRLDQGEREATDAMLAVDGSTLWPPDGDWSTSATGQFRIAGIPAGRVILRADAEGYRTVSSVEIESEGTGEQSGLEIQVRPATD